MRIATCDTTQKVFVVAEIGNNHEGRFEVAEKLVRQAAECGVDAVKFQTFQTRLFTSSADPARFQRLKGFELSYAQFAKLEELARSLGLLFMSTPLDLESADFLAPRVDAFKIASGDNNFWALLERTARVGKPLIVSSGMTDLGDIRQAVQFVRAQAPQTPLAVLHCVAAYPAPDAQVNLRAIGLLERELDCVVGYSDHTLGPTTCLAAVALGARIIEKHFTLDKHFSDFRDHQLSADPGEMKQLVADLRRVEALLGAPVKQRQDAEAGVEKVARRSIVAGADLEAGHTLRDGDLTWIRPANGLPPGLEGLLLGKRLKRKVAFGEPLQTADVE